MRKYTQKQLRELVRLGFAEDYTNKPADSWKIWKPARGTPLSGVAQTCLSCFEEEP